MRFLNNFSRLKTCYKRLKLHFYQKLNSYSQEIAFSSSLDYADLSQLFTSKKPLPTKTKLNIFHPDWNEIHEELSKKGMTRRLLWEELKEKQPSIYSYSQFNRYYKKFGLMKNMGV